MFSTTSGHFNLHFVSLDATLQGIWCLLSTLFSDKFLINLIFLFNKVCLCLPSQLQHGRYGRRYMGMVAFVAMTKAVVSLFIYMMYRINKKFFIYIYKTCQHDCVSSTAVRVPVNGMPLLFGV